MNLPSARLGSRFNNSRRDNTAVFGKEKAKTKSSEPGREHCNWNFTVLRPVSFGSVMKLGECIWRAVLAKTKL